MTVHRGRVTAVDAAGVYVRVAALGPDVVGPLEWLGSKPAADDGVLVVNAGTEAAPDLVVMLADNTGSYAVNSPAAAYFFAGSAGSGYAAAIQFHTGDTSSTTTRRWWVGKRQAAETGANAGSDFSIWRYGDDGSSLGEAVGISRASGLVWLGRSTVTADAATSVVTKGYVDAIKSALAASTSFADFQSRVAAL